MGIEEIQKVNALARELMRHGIAQTSDEAMLRAEEMLRANSVNSMTEAITSHSSMGKSGEAIMTNETISGLNMDIRSLGVRFEAVVREVLTLKDEIRKLSGNLGDMNRTINRLSVQQIQAPAAEQHIAAEAVQSTAEAPVQQSFAKEAVRPAAFEKPKMINVHNGKEEFKSEDVAIEKIFYFGK